MKAKHYSYNQRVSRNFGFVWSFLSIIFGVYFGILSYSITNGVIIFLVCCFIPILFRALKKYLKKRSYLHSSLYKVDNLNGHDFEEFLCANLGRLGYRVENVGSTGNDYGVDLIIRKGAKKIAVQAKRYKGKVGVEAVQQIIAGAEYYGCKNRMVITNSYFTPAARRLAEKCNVVLWDRDDCKKKLVTVRDKSEEEESK